MAQCYKRSAQALHSEVGGDVVALHIDRGQCYGMENVTADVWRLLAEPSDLDTICDQLQQKYDVDPEACRSDIATLLVQMQSEGLIEPS